MKKTTSLLSLVIASFLSEGLTAQQVKNVGINTETPNESAMLHIAPAPNFRHAIVKAHLNNSGGVGSYTIVDPGQGYRTAPKIFVRSAASNIEKNGVRASATAVIKDGKLVNITNINPGSGYTNTPNVSVIPQDAHYGFVLPRVDIQDPLDKETPVKVSHDTDGADGLLAFNSGKPNKTTQTESRPYWFDDGDIIKKWNEGVSALKTPKIAILSFPDKKFTRLDAAGGFEELVNIGNNMFQEPITNVLGIHTHNHMILFPRQKASYIIEVNLNVTALDTQKGAPCTGNCARTLTDDGFYAFGYFVNLDPVKRGVTLNEDGSVKSTVGLGNNRPRERKEQAIMGKLLKAHNGIWQFAVDIPELGPNERADAHYGYSVTFGRMSNSSHYGDVQLNSEGSFIKIYQIN